MPRTTNADRILSEARERLAAAERVEIDAAAELRLASAIVEVHRANLAAAEKLLAPKPRKKTEAKPAATKEAERVAAIGQPRPSSLTECAHVFEGGKICGSSKDSGIHDKSMGYAGYHEFQPGKPGRKAKQKPADLEKESAIAVGAD
jgi:hypothetical protein